MTTCKPCSEYEIIIKGYTTVVTSLGDSTAFRYEMRRTLGVNNDITDSIGMVGEYVDLLEVGRKNKFLELSRLT